MHVKVVHSYALSLWAMEQKVRPQNNLLLKSFRRIPQETKIFYHEQLKYPRVKFSQTTVYFHTVEITYKIYL